MKKNKKQCFGVIIGTRAYFNSELARDVRKQLLKTLDAEGYDYVILPEDATPTGSSSIETREDGLKCAELFRQNRDRIDGIIVSLPNFGFEIGIINAISVADLHGPVLVPACDDENDKVTSTAVETHSAEKSQYATTSTSMASHSQTPLCIHTQYIPTCWQKISTASLPYAAW